jgi:ornithine cyclodeaminase/alanine dehydrogenase-like protein (mu-crystallin family)
MATTSVYDVSTGQLVALLDATLLTALRTGAASAVATDILAGEGPLSVGVIGCGAQAVTQLHALSRVRDVRRIVGLDTDPAVAASFGRRVNFLDLPPVLVAPEADVRLLAEVDVLCTCTSVDIGKGPVLRDGPHKPWLHINAIGADFPGKQELPLPMLERALICPDLPEQCLAEGESQWVDAGRLGPDLATMVQNRAVFEPYRSVLTVFDSTGWALEDLVVAELFIELATRLRVGSTMALQSGGGDPFDPYAQLIR